MAVGDAGWLTNGLTIMTPDQVNTGLIPVDRQLTGGQSPQTMAVQLTDLGAGTQTVAAAGATVGTATAISATAGSVVIVTVTASTEGVKLPSITNVGMRFWVFPSTTVGAKVYAGVAGQSIGTGTTNTTAVVVAKNTGTMFVALSTTKWGRSV
jgi:hypothetical protein